jgi:hypothetical protein
MGTGRRTTQKARFFNPTIIVGVQEPLREKEQEATIRARPLLAEKRGR